MCRESSLRNNYSILITPNSYGRPFRKIYFFIGCVIIRHCESNEKQRLFYVNLSLHVHIKYGQKIKQHIRSF